MKRRLNISLILETDDNPIDIAHLERRIYKTLKAEDQKDRIYQLADLIHYYGQHTINVQVTKPRE